MWSLLLLSRFIFFYFLFSTKRYLDLFSLSLPSIALSYIHFLFDFCEIAFY